MECAGQFKKLKMVEVSGREEFRENTLYCSFTLLCLRNSREPLMLLGPMTYSAPKRRHGWGSKGEVWFLPLFLYLFIQFLQLFNHSGL